MKLQVKTPHGDTLKILVGGSRSVLDLKRLIYNQTEILPTQQILVFNGSILIDRRKLKTAGLVSDSMVYLNVISSNDRDDSQYVEQGMLERVNASDMAKCVHSTARNDPRFFHFVHSIQPVEEPPANMSVRDYTLIKDSERDRRLNIIESKPRGMITLAKFHKSLEAFIEETMEVLNETFHCNSAQRTVIPVQAEAPSVAPLPTGGYFDAFLLDDVNDQSLAQSEDGESSSASSSLGAPC